MAEQRKVVLYGNSLFMAGVEASLRDRDGLDVMRIDAILPGAGQRLSAFCPDVVIFDLAAPHSEFVLPFLREHLDLPLIGLDVTSSTVVVLSSRQYTAQTADDLARVIRGQAAGTTELRDTEHPQPEASLTKYPQEQRSEYSVRPDKHGVGGRF